MTAPPDELGDALAAVPVVRFTARPSTSPPEPLSAAQLADVIVLVVEGSALKNIAGSDVLRSVFAGLVRELRPAPERIVLQPLWDLLAAQPGFDPEAATAPVCRLALLKSRLGATVELPATLRELSSADVERYAQACAIDDASVDRVLAPAAIPPVPAGETETAAPTTVEPAPTAPVVRGRRRLRPPFIVAAGLVAVIAIVALVVRAKSHPEGTLEPRAISTEIALSSVRHAGHGIVAVAADPAKRRDLPLDTRRAQLEKAGVHARDLGATQLLLVEPNGTLLALVSLEGEPTVMFPTSSQD